MTEDTKAQVMMLYRRGESTHSIAHKLNESRTEVRKLIANAGSSLGQKTRRQSKNQVIKVAYVPPDYAPICNATATGIYRGEELSYRKPSAR